jgi:hypothetical protein
VTLTAAAGIQSGAEISTSADNVTVSSPLTLSDAVTVDTGSDAGSITFNQTVNGGYDLTLTAGLGSINFNQSAGQTSRLNVLKIVSTADATFAAAVSAKAFVQQAGSGTTTFNGLLHTSTAAGVSITGQCLHVATGITTTNSGTVTILPTGTSPNGVAIFDNFANINSDGAVSITASTQLTTGGNITTTNDPITVDATVVLTNNVTIDSGTTGQYSLYQNNRLPARKYPQSHYERWHGRHDQRAGGCRQNNSPPIIDTGQQCRRRFWHHMTPTGWSHPALSLFSTRKHQPKLYSTELW